MNRRRFLSLGAGGAFAAACSGAAAQEPVPLRKVKSVILLWMGGGLSPIETWDPKPGSPNSGGVKAIDSSVPGLRLSERLRRTAAQMDRISLVRSVRTNEVQAEVAEYLLHCGIYQNCADADPSLGTILAYELWDRLSAAPPFVTFDAPRIPASGAMGSGFLPVDLDGAEALRVREGAAARRDLLKAQDAEWAAPRLQRSVTEAGTMRTAAERSADAAWRRALDVSNEPEQLRAAYGPGFGLSCLRARRLLRAGVSVVEIGLHGWDQPARVPPLCAEFDAGYGTLIRDLAEKEMLRDTVVVCWGPFGRSPKPDANGARGPWSKAFCAALAGGHLAGGRVYGDTGKDGDESNRPVPIHDLFATIYAACGIDGNKKYETEGRKVKYVSQNGSISTSGTPLKELF